MANHKSALKRNRQSLMRRSRNRANKTKMKHAVRNINEAISGNSVEQAQEALKIAIPIIHKTAARGTIHKKNASRKVSRLTKKVNSFANSV